MKKSKVLERNITLSLLMSSPFWGGTALAAQEINQAVKADTAYSEIADDFLFTAADDAVIIGSGNPVTVSFDSVAKSITLNNTQAGGYGIMADKGGKVVLNTTSLKNSNKQITISADKYGIYANGGAVEIGNAGAAYNAKEVVVEGSKPAIVAENGGTVLLKGGLIAKPGAGKDIVVADGNSTVSIDGSKLLPTAAAANALVELEGNVNAVDAGSTITVGLAYRQDDTNAASANTVNSINKYSASSWLGDKVGQGNLKLYIAAGLTKSSEGMKHMTWTGDVKEGSADITMLNYGQWIGKAEEGTTVNLITKSASFWKPTGDTTITRWDSGTSISQMPMIDMRDYKDSKVEKVTIENLGIKNGWYSALYTTDGTGKVQGGEVVINKAIGGNTIKVALDNVGLNMYSFNADKVNAALKAMSEAAGKLTYTGDLANIKLAEVFLYDKIPESYGINGQGEYVKMGGDYAIGMATARPIANGTITFDENGKGSYQYEEIKPDFEIPDEQTRTEFDTTISGGGYFTPSDVEYAKAGVIKDDVYNFTKDSSIKSNAVFDGGAWMTKLAAGVYSTVGRPITIDLHDNSLNIDVETDSTSTGMSSITFGKLEINNAGPMEVNATSNKGGQCAALYVNGAGEMVIHNGGDDAEDKVIKLTANTTTVANGAVIKSMNGVTQGMSKLTIDGLVDILADAGVEGGEFVTNGNGVTYITGGTKVRGKGANEGISAVASEINIGGGRVVAQNGAAYAIRAYGEFVSENYGTVNFNVERDENGKPIKAGKNRAQIEGEFVTSGGMGTNGIISVGLNGENSYWKGNYKQSNGYGVTVGEFGTVNLFMDNGARWEGSGLGKVIVDMDNESVWTGGVSTNPNSTLNIRNGATFDPTAGSANQFKNLSMEDGVIILRGGQEAEAAGSSLKVLNDFSGKGTILMEADETGALTSGEVVINKAAADSVLNLSLTEQAQDITDSAAVNSLFAAMTDKLTYTAATEEEENLTAKLKLSAENISIAGTPTFNKETGKAEFDATASKDIDIIGTWSGALADNENDNLTLSEKAVWNATGASAVKELKVAEGAELNIAESLEVGKLEGKLNLTYGKEAAEGEAQSGGAISVGSAAEGSSIDMDVQSGYGEIEKLAGTVSYAGATKGEDNLKVKAAYEDEQVKETAEVTFDEKGKGQVANGTETEVKADWNHDVANRTNLTVDEGVTWTGANTNADNNVELKGDWKVAGESAVNELKVDGASVDMSTADALKVNKFEGEATMLYDHDDADPNNVIGGTVAIGSAAEGSTITMDAHSGYGSVAGLAEKISYEGATKGEDNLKVKAAYEDEQVRETANITFDEKGKGQVAEGTDTEVKADWNKDVKTRTNITVKDGVTWTGSNTNAATNVELKGTWNATGESAVDELKVAEGAELNIAEALEVGKLEGKLNLTYGKEAAEGEAQSGGAISVGSAAEGSSIDMDVQSGYGEIEKLAGTVSYAGATKGEDNLKVKAAYEDEQVKETAEVTFDEKGKGQVANGTETEVKADWNHDVANRTNLTVDEGATWTGSNTNEDNNVELKGTWNATGESAVDELKVAEGAELNIAEALEVGKLEGKLNLTYGKEAAEGEAQSGGAISVGSAAEGSSIDMDVQSGYGEIEKLAGTVGYAGTTKGEDNLKVKATYEDEQVKETAEVTFDEKGKGQVANGTETEVKADWKHDVANRTNLTVDEGATWTGSNTNADNNVNLSANSSWKATGESSVNGLSSAAGASINMSEAEAMNINSFSGEAAIIYGHDQAKPASINGGAVTIGSAAEGSKVTLSTDNAGIDMNNGAQVEEVLANLASKLTYTGAAGGEKNLTGGVQIAEGLTAASASLSTANMVFDDKGKGGLDASSIKPSIIYGSQETAMMKAVKTGMASSALMWRAEGNDLLKRMGEVRLAQEERGLWAKYYGGRYQMDTAQINTKLSYKAYQLGYDVKTGKNWTVGAAVSYNDGTGSFANGRGEMENTGFGIYGTMNKEDGQYVDLIAKLGWLKNDMTVKANGHELKNDYKTKGVSLSAEYGKRFEAKSGFYFDPSVEVTLGRLNGKKVEANSDYKDASGNAKALGIDQEDFKSLIGRVGFRIGKLNAKSSVYAKLALAHEFSGDFDTTFSAKDEPTKQTSVSFKDTWCEFQLGGTAKLGKNGIVYANFQRSFAGDVQEKYRVDAGLRWSF